MIRKLGPTAVTLLLAAGIASGCGGDDDKGDSATTAPPATTATASTPTAPASTTGTATAPDDVANDPRVKKAVQSCKDSIENNPSVKDEIKEDLKSICDRAASGDPKDVQAAIKEVCEKIVASSVPEGDLRDQALSACKSAVK